MLCGTWEMCNYNLNNWLVACSDQNIATRLILKVNLLQILCNCQARVAWFLLQPWYFTIYWRCPNLYVPQQLNTVLLCITWSFITYSTLFKQSLYCLNKFYMPMYVNLFFSLVYKLVRSNFFRITTFQCYQHRQLEYHTLQKIKQLS